MTLHPETGEAEATITSELRRWRKSGLPTRSGADGDCIVEHSSDNVHPGRGQTKTGQFFSYAPPPLKVVA